MRIIIDTREQQPFTFNALPDAEVERAALACGDYSLTGFEDRVAVERKCLDDLIGCLMGKNRERFERELAKARHYDLFAVVVEAGLDGVWNGRYRSAMKPHAAMQGIFAFQVRYRVPFLFCENRAGAEYVTYGLLQKYLAEIEKRYKIATKARQPAIAPGREMMTLSDAA